MFLVGLLSLFLAHESLADRFMDNHPAIANNTKIGRIISSYNESLNSAPAGPVDWNTYLGKVHDLFLEEVLLEAENDSTIQYCLFVTALELVLKDTDGNNHIFHYGDTLFFSEIPELYESRKADSYYKIAE